MSVFEVLAEPKRRQILDLLREGERPVGEIVDALAVAQPVASKHLRVLREAGLVSRRVEGPRRLYRINIGPLREIDDWVTPYRTMWNSALDALEQRLDETDPSTTGRPRRSRPAPSRRPSSRRTS